MPDWDATTWAIVSAIIAAIAMIAAVLGAWFGRTQARHVQDDAQDRRLTEKVNAAIGEKVISVSHLTDQAKGAVEEARENSAAVKQIRDDADQLSADLKVQRQQVAQDRAQLEEVLSDARTVLSETRKVLEQLNEAAQQAAEDVDVIRRARIVAETDEELRQLVEQLLVDMEYEIMPPHLGRWGPQVDIAAIPTDGNPEKHNLFIETKLAFSRAGSGPTARLAESFIRQLRDLAEREQGGARLENEPLWIVVIPEGRAQSIPLSQGTLHVVPFAHLRSFINEQNRRFPAN